MLVLCLTMVPCACSGVLAQFMSFHCNAQCVATDKFSWNELAEITAQDAADWMNHHAFSNTVPTDDDHCLHARSSSMCYWKKALSHFMPNENVQWNKMMGSYGICKFASRHLCSNRVTKDNKDHRGRWKSARRISD